jgi:hypothetical protein
MARPFAALEHFFERLFERPAARLFQTRLQPVQLQGRLERAMESERRLSGDRTYVPSRYRILIHPADLVAFDGFQSTVEHDLASSLHTRARHRGYTLLERPSVAIVASASVARGDVSVLADLSAPIQPPPRAGSHHAEPPPPPPPPRSALPGSAAPARTAVFEVAPPRVPSVVVDVRTPGRAAERLLLRGGTVRIGRADDNDLVLDDDRVSRHHGQLASRQGTLVFSDLGSTNGSFVNGSRVTQIALGPGDVLHLGGSTLTVEVAG